MTTLLFHTTIYSVILITFILLGIGIFNFLKYLGPRILSLPCNLNDINFPYKESTIPAIYMQITIAIFTFILVTFIEYCEANILKKELLDNEESKDKSIKFHKLLFIFSIYKILVISLMGNLFVSYTIHIIKYSVGRLRPNFVDVCKPKIFNETCINGIFKYYECTSEDIKQISESRLSFFSGHAAYAFFNAIFISTYIFIRSSKKSIGKKVGYFLAPVLVSSAIFVGVTRIKDYKHHVSDVIIGSVYGFIVALSICLIFKKYITKNEEIVSIKSVD